MNGKERLQVAMVNVLNIILMDTIAANGRVRNSLPKFRMTTEGDITLISSCAGVLSLDVKSICEKEISELLKAE